MSRPHQDAWVTGIRRESAGLLGFIQLLVGDRDHAEDLFQETCLEAWRCRARFSPEGDFGAWLRGIARKVALRHRRQAAGRRSSPFSPELMETLEREWTDQRPRDRDERCDALRSCLEELAIEQRETLRLRYNDHLALSELARRRSRSVDAIKMQLSRLRKKLFTCVEDRRRRENEHG